MVLVAVEALVYGVVVDQAQTTTDAFHQPRVNQEVLETPILVRD
jgi:hypothetical protein